MKAIIGSLIILTFAITLTAQDAKVIAELSASSEKVIKNSPFSADAISESVQTLADGNRIVRSSTSKLYRNSEGRFRRELNGSGGMLGSLYNVGTGVTILDPVAGQRYLLDPNLKTIRQSLLRPLAEVKIRGELANVEIEKQLSIERAGVELRALAPVAVIGTAPDEAVRAPIPVRGNVAMLAPGAAAAKYESRNEDLGTRTIEGVAVEGTRTVTTIPADAIGNERPIEITYERWYSKELELVVMSKHNDPRFGEQTYRLTNIVRAEPDASLFALPTGYKVLADAPAVYRISTAGKLEAERAAAAAAAKAPAPASKPKQ